MSPHPSAVVTIGIAIVLVNLVCLAVVPRGRHPQSALAWLFAIGCLPLLGLLLFLTFGRIRLPEERTRRHVDAMRRTRHIHAEQFAVWRTVPTDARRERISRLVDEDAPLPPLEGNVLSGSWRDTHAAITAMVDAIDNAQHTVHTEFYILLLDATTRPFFDALERARRRGVDVRVLFDHLGTRRYPSFLATERRLAAAGVQWHRALPLSPLSFGIRRPDLRNHRKLLVVDGNLAFLGSLNLVDPNYQRGTSRRGRLRWKDQWMCWRGPVVGAVEAVFIADWYGETGELLSPCKLPPPAAGGVACQVIASGPPSRNESNLRLFTKLIHLAEQRVVMITPYFVPDHTLLRAITSAAKSGVDVRLLTSQVGDQFLPFHAQRSYYDELLRAGVRVFQYPRPTILHCKQLTIDDDIAVVGSSNLDIRSFSLSMEISLLAIGRSLTPIHDLSDTLLSRCVELELATWRTRPMRHRVSESIARLTSPIL